MICSGANRSTNWCVKACKASRVTSGRGDDMTMSTFWPAMPAQRMKAIPHLTVEEALANLREATELFLEECP